MTKKKKTLMIVLLSVASVVATVLGAFGGFLIYASATTLDAPDFKDIEVNGKSTQVINTTDEVKIMSWNIGYASLDEKWDFYMDGGTHSLGESKENTLANVAALKERIVENDPDILFVQEIDVNSHRSFNVNQLESFKETFNEQTYQNTFAKNFQAGFIPIPLSDPLGHVESGIGIFSKYPVTSAKRHQLPIPFKWPINLFNLKRCLLVNRTPIEGSDKELVTINLHLEAYTEDEGKIKQLQQLMTVMQEEYNKGNYVIAGGDFNQTFSTTNHQKYPKISDWACPEIDATQYPDFQFLMDDTTPTCRSLDAAYVGRDLSTQQFWMIDGFIASNNVNVQSLQTVDYNFKNTDHNPVVMTFKLS